MSRRISAQITAKVRRVWENYTHVTKTVPNAAVNSAGTWPHLRAKQREVLVTISPRPTDSNPHPVDVLFNAAPKITVSRDRHWFVSDGAGYCQACNLPRVNGRHAARAA